MMLRKSEVTIEVQGRKMGGDWEFYKQIFGGKFEKWFEVFGDLKLGKEIKICFDLFLD